jgi:hypothetical protein
MKIGLCLLCQTIALPNGTNVAQCICGNVVIKYWEDWSTCTIAVKQPECASVWGYHTRWIDLYNYIAPLKNKHRLVYLFYWPWIQILKLWMWGMTEGRRAWIKPYKQAFCTTVVGNVTFYTYD